MSKANLSTPAYAAACVEDDKHQAARVKREAEFCACADDGEGNEPNRDPDCPDCGGSGAVIVDPEP